MNCVAHDLSFTTEPQSQYPDNHLPTLDAKLSMILHEGAQRVTYSFFEKPTNSKYTTLETSAACKEDKKSQLSQEIARRLLRMDNIRSTEEKIQILDQYNEKPERSGYSLSQIREITVSGIRNYYK